MEAHVNFANLDLLIGSLMNYQRWGVIDTSDIFGPRFDRINVFYSTPEYYTKMKYQETVKAKQATTKTTGLETEAPVQWSVKQDDFFPYSDCAHCFWTGYFTSRTAFKRLERVASSFLLAARQIESMPTRIAVTKGSEEQPLYELDDALGVVQHHDAVSGTAKQHVADDYSKRVQAGVNTASDYVAAKLKTIMLNASDTALTDLSYCQLLNETICDVSEVCTYVFLGDVFPQLYLISIFSPCSFEISSALRSRTTPMCMPSFTTHWLRTALRSFDFRFRHTHSIKYTELRTMLSRLKSSALAQFPSYCLETQRSGF
jgi:hypothetical protein